MAGMEVDPHRAQQPANVDAVMRIEAAILHGDERRRQVGRHLLELQPLADDGAAMADLDCLAASRKVKAMGRLTA